MAPRTVGAQISWRTGRIPAHAGRGGAVPAETICQRGSCTTISAEDSTWYPPVIHPVSAPPPLTTSPLALRFRGTFVKGWLYLLGALFGFGGSGMLRGWLGRQHRLVLYRRPSLRRHLSCTFLQGLLCQVQGSCFHTASWSETGARGCTGALTPDTREKRRSGKEPFRGYENGL